MWRRSCLFVEIALLSALVLGTRCANYGDVFVGGELYFTDADCYSRMTRARMCFEHPGVVIRHHQFENFPAGTNPHATAPFDYLIVGFAELLRPFSARALELAGAFISPALGLLGVWFLWWWFRRMRFRFRAAALFLFAASPIVVHATELGRPDHQSLALVLVVLAVCAEWTLHVRWSQGWSVTCAAAWGLALWVSLYEPLVIFAVVMVCRVVVDRRDLFSARQKHHWFVFSSVIVIACLVERRLPSWTLPVNHSLIANWLSTIGETRPLALTSRSWLEWCGYLLLVAPFLAIVAFRRRQLPPLFISAAVVATFCLTIWQARWSYFFVVIFSLALPALLSALKNSPAVIRTVICISMLPLIQAWDATLWPDDSRRAQRAERQREMTDLRGAATAVVRATDSSFIAPWWLSPAVAYWSGEPGVAGSSHQSLDGIAASARFFLATKAEDVVPLLTERRVASIIAYDADRTVANSLAVSGQGRAGDLPLAQVLDRTPSQAPPFLFPVYANGSYKVFRVEISGEKARFP